VLRAAPGAPTPVAGVLDVAGGTSTVRVTAVLAGVRTDSPVNIDLSVPIWTIEHVAAAFHLEVDTAREYTYREDFPRPRAGFSRNLWTREEVLAWFTALPGKPRGRSGRATVSTATVARTAAPRTTETRPTGSGPAAAPAGTRPAGGRPSGAPKPYTPRRKK
jgi:hypothetical protein